MRLAQSLQSTSHKVARHQGNVLAFPKPAYPPLRFAPNLFSGVMMKNLIVLLVVLAVGVAVYGYYHAWYQVATDQKGDNLDIHVNVDKNKVREDTEKAKEKLKDAVSQPKEKGNESTAK